MCQEPHVETWGVRARKKRERSCSQLCQLPDFEKSGMAKWIKSKLVSVRKIEIPSNPIAAGFNGDCGTIAVNEDGVGFARFLQRSVVAAVFCR